MLKNILCSKDGNSGPVYGHHMITAGKDGSFDIWLPNKEEPITVDLDGVNSRYRSVYSLGLTVQDFKDAPINKYGLKELAKYDDEVLVLTKNGLLVIYSGGLPSLQGLPSDVGPVSGMWIGKDGLVYAYPFSLFPENKLINFMKDFECLSFYKLNYNFLGMMYKIMDTDYRSYEKREEVPCTYFMDLMPYSRYLDLYPGFTEATIRRYNSLVNRNNYQLGGSLELQPIALDPSFGHGFVAKQKLEEYSF